MDKIIQHISGAFSEMGPLLTFLAIILIVIVFILKDPIGERLKKIRFRRTVIKDRKVKCLWSHDLFLTSKDVKEKISKMRFTTHGDYDPTKTALLKILVNNQINLFNKSLKEFIKREDVDQLEGQKLKYLLTECLRKSTESHNKLTLTMFIELGVSEYDSKFLIGEYDYFRDEVAQGFVERIESITTNESYHCNYDRLSAVFEVLAMGLYLIPKDAITACNRINGKFKKYDGKIQTK